LNDCDSVIEAENVIYRYPSGRGVRGVSLKTRAAECYAILGRNGSGKSTLTRLILGLEKPQSGVVRVFGDSRSDSDWRRFRKIGVVLDSNPHWENLSGFQNAYFFARSYGMPAAEAEGKINELFEAADLNAQARDKVATYSYGMRRKLAFAQALVHDPDLLILDEATAGLDAHFMEILTVLIRERGQRGKATWIAGNDPDWIANAADRVVFMDQGLIIEEGSPDELMTGVSELREVRIALQDFSPVPLIDIPGVTKLAQNGNTITALISRDLKPLPDLLSWLGKHTAAVSHIDVVGGTLRDAFLLRTGKTLDQ